MANHLTPTELAREAGLERREVLTKCVELGVPVFHGYIDKSLFMASLRELPEWGAQRGTESAASGPAGPIARGRSAPR
jgi:hypothetical protein